MARREGFVSTGLKAGVSENEARRKTFASTYFKAGVNENRSMGILSNTGLQAGVPA
jgi:hypothetical protein